MRINVTSMVLMSRYAIPEMRKNGRGAIVNLSSVSGLLGGNPSLLYPTCESLNINFSTHRCRLETDDQVSEGCNHPNDSSHGGPPWQGEYSSKLHRSRYGVHTDGPVARHRRRYAESQNRSEFDGQRRDSMGRWLCDLVPVQQRSILDHRAYYACRWRCMSIHAFSYSFANTSQTTAGKADRPALKEDTLAGENMGVRSKL
jgi:hypothetical protein